MHFDEFRRLMAKLNSGPVLALLADEVHSPRASLRVDLWAFDSSGDQIVSDWSDSGEFWATRYEEGSIRRKVRVGSPMWRKAWAKAHGIPWESSMARSGIARWSNGKFVYEFGLSDDELRSRRVDEIRRLLSVSPMMRAVAATCNADPNKMEIRHIPPGPGNPTPAGLRAPDGWWVINPETDKGVRVGSKIWVDCWEREFDEKWEDSAAYAAMTLDNPIPESTGPTVARDQESVILAAAFNPDSWSKSWGVSPVRDILWSSFQGNMTDFKITMTSQGKEDESSTKCPKCRVPMDKPGARGCRGQHPAPTMVERMAMEAILDMRTFLDVPELNAEEYVQLRDSIVERLRVVLMS